VEGNDVCVGQGGLNDQESGDVKQYICARPLHHDVAVDWCGQAIGMGTGRVGDRRFRSRMRSQKMMSRGSNPPANHSRLKVLIVER